MATQIRCNTILLAAVLLIAPPRAALAQQQQKINPIDLDKVQTMLRAAYNDVKKDYYDPKYHGIDLDARYHEVDGKLKSVGSLNEGMRLVCRVP